VSKEIKKVRFSTSTYKKNQKLISETTFNLGYLS